MKKINPCPFCGSTDVQVYESADSCGRNVTYTVECYTCDPFKKTKDEAIEFWNTRKHYYAPAFNVSEYYEEATS